MEFSSMKSPKKHMIGRFSKAFAMLLVVVFCLGAQELKAQREIQPWESEFDYSYALTKIFPFSDIEIPYSGAYPQYLHYNQFYSTEMKSRNINVYEIKTIISSIADSSLERREYKDGYLVRLLNKNLNNTDSSEYLYKYYIKKKNLKIYCSYKSFKENALYQHIVYEANFNKRKQLISTRHTIMPSVADRPTANINEPPVESRKYVYEKSGRLNKIIRSNSYDVYANIPYETIDFSYTSKRKPSVPIDLYTFTAGIDSMLQFCIDKNTNSYVFDSVVSIQYNNSYSLLEPYDTFVLRDVYYVKSIVLYVKDDKTKIEKIDSFLNIKGKPYKTVHKVNFSKSFIAFSYHNKQIKEFIRSNANSHLIYSVSQRNQELPYSYEPHCRDVVIKKEDFSSKVLDCGTCKKLNARNDIESGKFIESTISLPIQNNQIINFRESILKINLN
ncbi:MAG: hypothetical protein IT256_08205 [Chitinophagaceae bacterium]|nr:hypothetical protein [Chitinophagaceae bacterium]